MWEEALEVCLASPTENVTLRLWAVGKYRTTFLGQVDKAVSDLFREEMIATLAGRQRFMLRGGDDR